MNRISRNLIICMVVFALALLVGCMNNTAKNQGGNSNRSNGIQTKSTDSNGKQQLNQPSTNSLSDAGLYLINQNGRWYVPVRKLAETLEFKSEWDADTNKYRIGDNDVAYEIAANSRQVMSGGESIQMRSPSVTINGAVCIPADELGSIFGDAMNYKQEGNMLRIMPNRDNPQDDSGLPEFADDPNDPFGARSNQKKKVSIRGDIPAGVMLPSMLYEGANLNVSLQNVNIDAMLRTAQNYIGVRYQFGAKPYPQSKRFDCSTFTQYIYGRYGVKLPRLSRQQALIGTTVSRTSLRKGDLLFFNVPGRYKSNKIVGHVGIYMGNGRMINATTSPQDGVQISNINKAYWKKTFLRAKRVAY